jgi:4-amino-4-deoxychorismate lyase
MADFESFGSISGESGGCLSDLDRGFAYGDGLFETMRLERGRLPFWSLHRERLLSDSRRLQLTIDFDVLQLQLNRMLAEAAQRRIESAVVKVIVSRGQGGRGYQPAQLGTATVVVRVYPFPDYPAEYRDEGVSAFICQYRLGHNPQLAGIKHLNKLDYVLASLEWRDTGCAEGMLFDIEGQLVEACSRNVFVVKNRNLLTPSLHRAGVAGILRRRVLEDYAGELGLVVRECAIELDDLMNADEVFLTNSVTGVWPVLKFVGSGAAQRRQPATCIARQIQSLFERDMQVGIATEINKDDT